MYGNQLCPAIRLQQGPPCCPAGDRYTEEHGDNTSPAGSSFIRLIGNYFEEHFLLACFSQPHETSRDKCTSQSFLTRMATFVSSLSAT